MSIALDLFLDNGHYKNIFLENDRNELYSETSDIFKKMKENYEVTHLYFHTKDGYNFLRVHNKDIYGDQINRFSFLRAQNSGIIGSGIELGKTAFALRVVKPYYTDNQLIGYVEFGQEIDNFLDILKENEGGDFSIFVDKQYLNEEDWKSVRETTGLKNNWNDFDKYITIDSTIGDELLDDEDVFKKCFNSKNSEYVQTKAKSEFISIEKDIDKKSYMCGGIPLYDAGNRLVGSILVVKDFSEFIAISDNIRFYLTVTIIILAILLALIYLIFIHKMIVKPIEKLSLLARKISEGNLKERLLLNSKDEISDLANSFNEMSQKLSISKEEIETKIAKRTEQLEKFNQSMVGRELKMIELKKEIIKLKEQLTNKK